MLANEQIVGGECERCGTPPEKKALEQWFFKITDYADRLLADLDTLESWPENVVKMQENWIGRSEGAEVVFTTEAGDPITVFTTRPDTLWGATFMVLAPEHPLVEKLTTAEQREAVDAYRKQAERGAHWATVYLPIFLTVAVGGTVVLGYALVTIYPVTKLLYALQAPT